MNITYYKKHARTMRDMLRNEKNKDEKYRSQLKINRLERSIMDCNERIKVLQKKYRAKQKKEKK